MDEKKLLSFMLKESEWNANIIEKKDKNDVIINACKVENNLYEKLKYMIENGHFN